MKSTTWILISTLAGLLVLVQGCTYQSVHHLKRQAWEVDNQNTLSMDYLTFSYICGQQEASLSVQGRAYPRKEAIPEWAGWIDDIWLGAYLSDQSGRVLASSLRILSPQPLKPEEGLPFEFNLKPNDMGSPGPVFISFGYRLVLTPKESSRDSGQPPQDPKNIFFASESALTRF
jgi:hypothetical protein